MTLDQYRIECDWSRSEMAREAKMDYITLNKAITGETISNRSAEKLARAISVKLGRSVTWQEIEGLNVK
jgi:ribosome-binding protein aMBF1 (putative translation factor)